MHNNLGRFFRLNTIIHRLDPQFLIFTCLPAHDFYMVHLLVARIRMETQVDLPGERSSKRPRSAIACHRCKQRKQRCDNGFPSCPNFIGAGHSLESRIAGLQQQLVSLNT